MPLSASAIFLLRFQGLVHVLLQLWTLVAMLATFTNSLLVPLRVAFQTSSWPAKTMVLDFWCDAIQAIDIALGFFTGFYSSGSKVTDRREVQIHYLRTGFPIALLSLLPFDLLQV